MTVCFADHVALLTVFIERHNQIVEDIEKRLLNVQGKDIARNRSRAYFEQTFSACCFESPGIPRALSSLKGQLAAAHRADGFEPVLLEEHAHQLDPLELLIRAYEFWDHHRWPGRNARMANAKTLYSVFMLRQLEDLSLRIWDHGHESASPRLDEIQRLLDRLNETTRPNVFVRDARWLILTAQGPLTRHLEPYFRIAENISRSFTDAQRLELHTAGATLAGGHLRSQLRYRASEMNKPADDPEILAVTRNSNSMDLALLVGDLVPALEAYASARLTRNDEQRLDLADAIFQGLSADPELLLTRLDLLAPATMIEDLFIDCGGPGGARYTATGDAHLTRLARYTELIADLAGSLEEDASTFNPAERAYSPLGISYGFCADMLSNMAMSTLVSQPSYGLSLEDTFVSRRRLEDIRGRANGWEKLPGRQGEREHFEHSTDWAQQVFDRTRAALEARRLHKRRPDASNLPAGRLFVIRRGPASEPPPERVLREGLVSAQEYCLTSDLQRALSTGATAFPKSQILSDRKEGRFLASAETGGKWFGVSKVILTRCVREGRQAFIADVPSDVVDVLRLTCPLLITVVA